MLKMLRQYDRYGYGIFTGVKLSITATLLYVFAMLFHINDANALIGLVVICIGVIELAVLLAGAGVVVLIFVAGRTGKGLGT
jgi:hypothetical protein